MFYGRGAGGGPTAIAVVGDVIDAARNLRQGAVGPHMARPQLHPVRRIDEIANQFYVRLEVDDRPGVLAAVAGVFAAHDVSIKSVLQHDDDTGAELVLVTHHSREADMDATLADLAALDGIREVASRMRVTGDGDV
jgi:homoserine dehydrogenase